MKATPSLPGSRIDHLLIVRGFAAFCVLTQHLTWTLRSSDWPRLLAFGPINLSWIVGGCDVSGVFLFFCLSGYLMGKGFFRGRYTPREPWRFYWRRFFRIVPAYTFYIAIVFTVGGLAAAHSAADVEATLKYLFTFTYAGYQGIEGSPLTGHLWSISTEMQFYALVPLFAFAFSAVFGKMGPRGVLAAIALLIIAGFSYRYYIWLPHRFGVWHDQAYVSVIANFDLFCGGMLLNFVPFDRLRLPYPRQVALLFGSIALMYLTCSFITYYSRIVALEFTGWFTYVLPSVSAVFAVWLVYVAERMNSEGPVAPDWARVLRPLAYAGTLTFSFYVWHDYFLEHTSVWLTVPGHPLLTYLARFLVVGSTTAIVAAISYEIIERPFMHLCFPLRKAAAAPAAA